MGLVQLIKEIFRKKLRDSHCPVGDVDIDITSNPDYGPLPWPLHNFEGDYIVNCPKMNKEWEDDGGCFCVTTDVPGTCLSAPHTHRQIGEYRHKWCRYLPIKDRERDGTPVV